MTLDENDFLTFQLFTASKTPRIKRARIRSWILSTVTFLCLAYLFYSSDNAFLGNYFLVFSGMAAMFFPIYSRWRYKRHYLKYIQDTYKNRFGEKTEIEFSNTEIRLMDKTGEMKLNKSEIEEIDEIKDYYFLKLRTGAALIISKNKTDDVDKIRTEIKSLVETSGVKYNVDLDWKWR